MPFTLTSICARYKSADGWHVFTSDELPGLCVASKNPATAFNDVGPSIEKLLLLDEGIRLRVTPEDTLSEFLQRVKGNAPQPADLVMQDKRFSVVAEA